MAVDTRYKRAASMSVCQPTMWSVHSDTSSGVDSEERWGAGLIYIGITVEGAAAVEMGAYYYFSLLSGGDLL